MPTPQPKFSNLSRFRPALIGLGVGVVGMLVLAAFSSVLYSGKGFGAPLTTPRTVYSDF